MSLRITIQQNEFSPALAKLRRRTQEQRRDLLEAAGLVIVSLTQRAFTEEGLRPASWPAKKDGTPSRLIESRSLQRSIRIVATSSTSVEVGSDRVYAAIHQTGGTIVPKNGKALKFQYAPGKWVTVKKVVIPARPYFPIDAKGELTATAAQEVAQVIADELGK